MDDDYYSGGEDGASGDLSLPKATVSKLIGEMLPSDISCSKESRDLLIDCCVEFIHLISSEANETCEREKKKTISPEHIVSALKSLGFSSYVAPVEAAYEEHRTLVRSRERKTSALESSGLSEAQLLAEQEALFEKARKKYRGEDVTDETDGSNNNHRE